MKLSHALRIQPGDCISFSGSGGKTTAIITLARELDNPVIVTTTTHFGTDQLGFADRTILSSNIKDPKKFVNSIDSGITLLIGEPSGNNRVAGPPSTQLDEIYKHARTMGINLLIESDGSRQRALKAPAAHEPVIPSFVDRAVVVAGLSALGKPMSAEVVHRVEQYKELSNLEDGGIINLEAASRVLSHDQGGRKGIPGNARSICLLNQADDEILQGSGKRLANELKTVFDSVIVAALLKDRSSSHAKEIRDESVGGYSIYGVHEPVSGIILAAGGSKRLGRPKQLLSWKGSSLIREVVSTVIGAGLDHIVVVLGAYEPLIRNQIDDLPVDIVVNQDWESGQSSSVQTGISAIPEKSGSVIFCLVDQPYLSHTLIRSMIDRHAETLAPIIAPRVAGQRGNPVLFDRSTFHEFQSIHGDSGGKQLFSRYRVSWVEWHDEAVLMDIDTDEDYRRLITDS